MIYTITTIKPVCDELHQTGKTIVLATGFFDLLHSEHLNFLNKAKDQGNILIVGVESDLRARILKGEGRPIEPQKARCRRLAPHADYVVALPEAFNLPEDHDSLMSVVRPNVYAISSHTSHQINKRLLTEKYGGSLVVVHEFNPKVSTTKLITQNQV